jgi:hypothetical protein
MNVRLPDGTTLDVDRPTHGAFDVGLYIELAAISMKKEAAGEWLCRDLLTALRELCHPLPPAVEDRLCSRDVECAISVADAVAEALGLTEAALGALRAAVGQRGACGRYLLGQDDEIVRAYEDGDPPHPCEFDCAPGHCLLDDGVPVEIRLIIRDWKLCGGQSRGSWPKAGGLADQDAATVFWFHELDRLAETELRRGTRQASNAEAERAGV